MADGHIITALEEQGRGGAVTIDGQTLLPGDVLTIDGEIFSLASGELVVDGKTESWSTVTAVPSDSLLTSGGGSGTGSLSVEATSAQTSSAVSGERRRNVRVCSLMVALALIVVGTW